MTSLVTPIYMPFQQSPPLLHKLHSQEQGKLTSGLGARLGNSFGGLPYLSQGKSLVIKKRNFSPSLTNACVPYLWQPLSLRL